MNNELIINDYRPVRVKKPEASDFIVSLLEIAGTVLITLAVAAFIIGTAIAASS